MFRFFDKKKTQRNRIDIILLVILIVQFLIIAYFNLFMSEDHVQYDTSWVYLKTTLIAKEKRLFNPGWYETTTLFLDTVMPIAALLYSLGMKLFTAYGLCNILVIFLTLVLFRKIGDQLYFNTTAKLLCMNLFICPFMTNEYDELNYFGNILGGFAQYAVRILLFLLIIYLYFELKNDTSHRLLIIISFVLCLITGISSGIYMIIMVTIPLFIYSILYCIRKESLKPLLKKESIYACLCSVFVFAGNLTARYGLHFISEDSNKTWTSIENIWKNIGAVLQGFMKLMGVLPTLQKTKIRILSTEGISYIFPIILFCLVIAAIIYAIKKNNEFTEITFFIILILYQVLMFSLFNVPNGKPLFEERYLLCLFMCAILLSGYFIQHISNKILVGSIWLCITVGLIGTNIISDRNYIKGARSDLKELSKITEIIHDNNVGLTYIWSDPLDVWQTRIIGKVLRVYDLENIYKIVENQSFWHVGDYSTYEINEEYTGNTAIIVKTGQEETIPEAIRKQYKLIQTVENYDILISDRNPVDLFIGFTSDSSYDYPHSYGMSTANGDFTEKGYRTSGEQEGFSMWGPYTRTKQGIYTFTLEYEMENEGDGAVFDVVLDEDKQIMGEVKLLQNKTQASISDVPLEKGHYIEYRVHNGLGCNLTIKRIIIEKQLQ